MPQQKICSNTPLQARYPFPAPPRVYGSIRGIGVDIQVAQERIKSPRSLKRAKPGSFKTIEFFTGRNGSFQKSYLEISKAQGIQELTAKKRIQSDIENGYITKEHTTYNSPKHKTDLNGRNIYHLTEKGKKEQNLLRSIPQSNNSSKEEYIAKSPAPESDFQSKIFQKAMLQKYGFTHLIGRAPSWWFKDLELLKKTFKLLRQKKSKGYKAHCDLKWITSTLKQEGIGYREKVAKEIAKKLSKHLPFQTPFEETVLKALQSLQSKGLDTSHTSLKILLRSGLLKLSQALSVLQKYIQWKKPIKSLNGMLSWLVGQKDPLELLKPIVHSTEKQITKLKTFLSENAANFTFNKPTAKSAAEKPHIELLIHSKSLNASIVKLYKKIQGEWKCLTLEVGRTTGNFCEVVLLNIQKHFGGQYVAGN